MARNSNNNEALIPIESVVAVTGYPPEWVWARLDERDVETDWDGSFAVRWSTAKRLADDARTAREENDQANIALRESQEEELKRQIEEGQRRAVARMAAAGRRTTIHGVEVSVPGEPRPDWAAQESE
jgi:hypothetical protein